MGLSFTFALEMVLNLISLIVAAAMLLLVLWQSRRQRSNQLAALRTPHPARSSQRPPPRVWCGTPPNMRCT